MQRLIQQRHRAPIGGAPLRNDVSDGHRGQRPEFLLDVSAPLLSLFGLAGIGERRRCSRRDLAKIFLSQRDAFLRLYIAQHQQHGVIGHVVRLEKCLHVSQVRGIEISKITVKIMRVRPIAKSDRRHVQPRETAIRLVHHVDANFFLHNVALVFQIFVIYFQRAHAVRFEPQHALQRIRRDCFVVVRHVVARRAIQHAATGIDQLDVLHLRRIRGTLKHHVFEQVRKPAATLRLKTESNLVVHAHGDHRRRGIRRDHNI